MRHRRCGPKTGADLTGVTGLQSVVLGTGRKHPANVTGCKHRFPHRHGLSQCHCEQCACKDDPTRTRLSRLSGTPLRLAPNRRVTQKATSPHLQFRNEPKTSNRLADHGGTSPCQVVPWQHPVFFSSKRNAAALTNISCARACARVCDYIYAYLDERALPVHSTSTECVNTVIQKIF